MEITLFEVLEAVTAVKEVVDVINGNTDGELIPQEVTDVLKSFGDSEQGNNDIEILLTDIKKSLITSDESAYMEMVSNRLDVIDERLNAEFIALNDCLGLIATCFLSFFAFKVITWFYNLLSR